ncbi:MAG: hypothetical protein NTW94_06315 [Legionellales bacterium]|nr:hypothetical protein [Legionellales bacterium]
MRLTIPTAFKQLIGATSSGSSLYAFTSLILFPMIIGLGVAYGVPVPEWLFSQATSIVASTLTGGGLLWAGLSSRSNRAEKKTRELAVDRSTRDRIDALFKKTQTLPQDLKITPHLDVTRADRRRILQAGLTQATTTWAISSIIFVPLFALPPLGIAAIALSTLLALSVGLYYANLKHKEINREKMWLAQYKTASSQLNAAMKIHRKHHVLGGLPIGDSLSLTVTMLSDYETTQKWPHRKALTLATLFGAMTGSSVATILGTLIFVALATTPVGWVMGAITLSGAIFMGINSYGVQQAKLTRERNIALAREYRNKTEDILQQVAPKQAQDLTPKAPLLNSKKTEIISPKYKGGPLFIKLKSIVIEVRKKHPEKGGAFEKALREALTGQVENDLPAARI